MEEVADEETEATCGMDIRGDNKQDQKSARLPDNYCQPTSSKVKVEDMVTNEMDNEHFKEHHTEEAEIVEKTHKHFWDRSISSQNMVWPGDAQMPVEWNMVINNMRGIEDNPQGY